MNLRLLPLALVTLALLLPAADLRAEVAEPAVHPYVDPAVGRAGYRLAGEKVNEARVYDFYGRQADYYLTRRASGEAVPELLPAYPGLDAGKHGHWGKHNQNNHRDGRWNDVDHGPVVAQVFRTEGLAVLKALCLKLGGPGPEDGKSEAGLSAVFDTQSLSYRAVWEGGFVAFDPYRWGGSRNASPRGRTWFKDPSKKGWDGDAPGRFTGAYRHGDRVILSYRIGGVDILDLADIGTEDDHPVFRRSFEFPDGVGEGGLRLRLGVGLTGMVIGNGARMVPGEDGASWLEVGPQDPGVNLSVTLKPAADDRYRQKSVGPVIDLRLPPKLSTLTRGGPARFPHRVTVAGQLGGEGGIDAGRPYVVDTVPVPFDNPFKTVMQLSGLAFTPAGDALVSVLCGEVWKVSGLGGDLANVSWKRYATGFNQPVGVHIDGDGVFVLDRGRITRLHDLNGDDEADFYENYADDFGGYDRSHTHTWGLVRTADRAFHFVQREAILRTAAAASGSASALPRTGLEASGVRNCMGVGLWQDRFYVAPQEGNWTPASMIIEVHAGEFYGHGGSQFKFRDIAPPLCYVPRGLDNSTGSMVAAPAGDAWGPLGGHFIGLSYGSGTHYLILRDGSGPRAQGASVPLEGEFRAGPMRGAFHPGDGQLYLVGLDGWGDYSVDDGCFNRVRYTGRPLRVPVGFRVHANGLRVEFSCPLDPAAATEVDNYFAHQWNYEYAQRYGSPEFSVRRPGTVGHDPVAVRSVKRLGDGRAIFVEIPDLVPSLQLHLRMHLADAGGTAFRADLFPSVLYLGEHLALDGLAPPVTGKLTVANLPVRRAAEESRDTVSGQAVEGAREIVVEVLGGLRFKQTELTAAPGEALALKLVNPDIMPHNLVLVAPGQARVVGEASFKMLNDPRAGEKHYVPDLPSVLAHTFVVPPGGSHVTHFRAPETPGHYPYICTFPGHWQAMQGVLVVPGEESR